MLARDGLRRLRADPARAVTTAIRLTRKVLEERALGHRNADGSTKNVHMNLQRAKRAARATGGKRVHAYRCAVCSYWHVGAKFPVGDSPARPKP